MDEARDIRNFFLVEFCDLGMQDQAGIGAATSTKEQSGVGTACNYVCIDQLSSFHSRLAQRTGWDPSAPTLKINSVCFARGANNTGSSQERSGREKLQPLFALFYTHAVNISSCLHTPCTLSGRCGVCAGAQNSFLVLQKQALKIFK